MIYLKPLSMRWTTQKPGSPTNMSVRPPWSPAFASRSSWNHAKALSVDFGEMLELKLKVNTGRPSHPPVLFIPDNIISLPGVNGSDGIPHPALHHSDTLHWTSFHQDTHWRLPLPLSSWRVTLATILDFLLWGVSTTSKRTANRLCIALWMLQEDMLEDWGLLGGGFTSLGGDSFLLWMVSLAYKFLGGLFISSTRWLSSSNCWSWRVFIWTSTSWWNSWSSSLTKVTLGYGSLSRQCIVQVDRLGGKTCSGLTWPPHTTSPARSPASSHMSPVHCMFRELAAICLLRAKWCRCKGAGDLWDL